MEDVEPKPQAPVRVRGAARLEEGYARKLRFPKEDGEGQIEVVLCRVDGRLFALDSYCPHAGGRIGEGPLAEGRYAVCPLHFYKFDPRSGEAHEVDCDPAGRYRVEEVGTDVDVWLNETL